MASSQSTNKDTSAKLHCGQHVLIYIERMRNDESLYDVVFIVENERLPAHRCLVAAASPVLRKMLTNGMKETYQREIPLKEVNADVWRVVLDYVYTGRIDLINVENALRYLECANRFQMEQLKQVISSYVKQKIDKSNCCEVLTTADFIDCDALFEKSLKTVVNNFHSAYRTSGFKKLSCELVLKILRRRELIVRSELDVFLAAVLWFLCSGVSGIDFESTKKVAKRACEMLKQDHLEWDGLKGVESGTGDTRNYGELFDCVNLNNMSNGDLRRTAKFCRGLCKDIQTTCNVDLVHMREFSEKAVDKHLRPHNPIQNMPLPPHCRLPHGRYDPSFTFSQRFDDVQNLSREKSPVFVDRSRKLKWYVDVYFEGDREAVRGKFLSCYLCRKAENSSEDEEDEEKLEKKIEKGEKEESERGEGEDLEFSSQIFLEVDNDNGQSATKVFWKTMSKQLIRNVGAGMGFFKFVPLSALERKHTVIVGASIYFKSK